MKYYKPKSLTWWVSVSQIALGLAIAISGNVISLYALNGVLMDLTGGMGAYTFMVLGLGGVGLRGAIK